MGTPYTDLGGWVFDEATNQMVRTGEPAMFSTDSNGSTVLVGADGAIIPTLGAKTLTIGPGGMVSNLTDAIAMRAAQEHTLLTTFTGSVSGTSSGTVDVRKIVPDSGTPLASFAGVKGIGVRIGGSGPIVRAYIGVSLAGTVVFTRYPIPQDYTSVQIDLYSIKSGAIVLLPGTLLEDATENMQIPAFTTVSALVRRTAGIVKTGGTGTMFSEEATQNEIYFSGLYLKDALNGSDTRFWRMPNSITHVNQPMCDFGVYDCAVDTASQDVFYVANGLTIAMGGGFSLQNSQLRGTFDVFYGGPMRHLDVGGNVIEIQSEAQALDGGYPSGVVMVGGSAGAYDYPLQRVNVSENIIDCRARATIMAEDSKVIGVDFRQWTYSSKLVAVVKNNTIKCAADNANASGVVTGLRVNNASAVTTPTFIFKDNELQISGAGGVTPTLATSNRAASPVLMSGNVAMPGGVTTLGSNTTALTTY